MVHHYWGDPDFDWNELNRATAYICKLYSRCTGKWPCVKEKYGTLRCEYEQEWITSNEEAILFAKILVRATHKFPKVKAELTSDTHYMFDIKTKTMEYYKGYLEGVLHGSSESRRV